jgi:transcriptional regulator with XRE-family HTH domain
MKYAALGRRIRTERQRNGLTQEKLAERVGISTSFLGHIERGSRKASLETLVNIANSLEMGVDSLLADSLNYRCADYVSEVADVHPELRRAFNSLMNGYLTKAEPVQA